ncbi:MAG TPA: mycofactocin precursor MftA [Thermoleophilaceae bacterium]|jgi:mycofactocin precursor
MAEDPTPAQATMNDEADTVEPQATEEKLVLDDLLVEDVSIDGMCGVY